MRYKSFQLPLLLLATLLFCGCRNYNLFNTTLPDAKTSVKINPLKSDYQTYNFEYSYIFNHEVKDNICQIALADTSGLNKNNMGRIEYRIVQDKSTRNPLWSLFCTITSIPFRIPALVGIPVGHRKAKIKLEVDVKDEKGAIVKTYAATGKHSSFITCYWGYKKEDADNKAHNVAFQKAMTSGAKTDRCRCRHAELQTT